MADHYLNQEDSEKVYEIRTELLKSISIDDIFAAKKNSVVRLKLTNTNSEISNFLFLDEQIYALHNSISFRQRIC
jgi:hypothetical protein